MRWWEHFLQWVTTRRRTISSITTFASQREAMEQATRRPVD